VIRGVFWLSSHVDPEIAESYTKLLLNIPASSMNDFDEKYLDEDSKKSVLRRVWMARRSLMAKPQRPVFYIFFGRSDGLDKKFGQPFLT
jgi:hypothetical protein